MAEASSKRIKDSESFSEVKSVSYTDETFKHILIRLLKESK